ncbi:MAG: DUF3995 domain-containing protein [Myxococcales bacterium]
MIAVLGLATAAVLVALAGLHFYWAAGGRWKLSAAVPEVRGAKAFSPGPLACAAVGAALLCAAFVVSCAAGLWLADRVPHTGSRAGAAALAVVLIGRAIGDGRSVGFSKRVKGTRFARLDTRIYSPLCLALGAASAIIAAA